MRPTIGSADPHPRLRAGGDRPPEPGERLRVPPFWLMADYRTGIGSNELVAIPHRYVLYSEVLRNSILSRTDNLGRAGPAVRWGCSC